MLAAVPTRIMFGAMMVLTFPLACVFPLLKRRLVRQLFGSVVGAAMLVLIFGMDSLHFFVSALATYAFCRLLPGRLLPYLMLPLAFGHVFYCHLSIQFNRYLDTSTNITGTQMILALKLISFAYNCRDGALYNKLDESFPAEKRQRSRALRKIPSFLEFFSFCFFFGTVLAGPYFEYLDFDEWVSMRSKGSMKWQMRKALGLLSFALPCMVLTMMASSFPMSFIVDDATPDMPWHLMVASVFASEALFRTKYYFAWMTAEGASAAAGFGYRTPDEIPGAVAAGKEEGDWELLCNVHPLKVEFPSSLGALGTVDWNMSVSKFMRRYVFDRLAGRKSEGRGKARLLTFLVSAMWHGFYMGYYLFFVSYFFFETVELENQRKKKNLWHRTRTALSRRLKPWFQGKFLSSVWDVLAVCLATTALNYNGAAFVLLDHWMTLKLWQRMYFAVHIGALLLLVVAKLFPRRSRPDTGGNKPPTEDKPKQS